MRHLKCDSGLGTSPHLNVSDSPTRLEWHLKSVGLPFLLWFFLPKVGHSGSNLASNIADFKTSLLMWHIVNKETGICSNIICYHCIALPKTK